MLENELATDGLMVTGFTLGSAAFGVDAALVQEVVKVGDLTRVHGAPSDVVGIRNLRGRIVTVVDMAIHLGLGSAENGPEARLLIMEHQGESYGFLVDTVTDAIAIEAERLGAVPPSLDPALRSRLRGVWRDEDRLTAIIDSATLFQWGGTTEHGRSDF